MGLARVYDDAYSVTIVADSTTEAIDAYLGDYSPQKDAKTYWIRICAVMEDDSDDHDDRIIAVHPEEPRCSHEEGHDWQSPWELVGGVRENPGVWGNEGGVVITEACVRCGCKCVTDTWAQDPVTGEQGLTSISYEEGVYSDGLRDMRAKEIAKSITDSGSLQELRDLLNDLHELIGSDEAPYVDITGLPTFFDEEPNDTREIFSWDEEHILVCCEGEYLARPWRLLSRD